MATERVFEILTRDSFFPNLPESRISQLIQSGEIVRYYHPKTMICEQGKPADFWFIPFRGNVVKLIWNPNETREESDLSVSRFPGIHEFLSEERYLNHIVVSGETSAALKLSRQATGSSFSELDEIIRQELVKDCQELRGALEMRLTKNPTSRLVSYLVRHVTQNNGDISNGHSYLNWEELGIEAGLSRQNIRKAITFLKKEGVMEDKRAQLRIIGYDKLVELHTALTSDFPYPAVKEQSPAELAKLYCLMHDRLNVNIHDNTALRIRNLINQQIAQACRLNQKPYFNMSSPEIEGYIFAGTRTVRREIEYLRRNGTVEGKLGHLTIIDTKKADTLLLSKGTRGKLEYSR